MENVIEVEVVWIPELNYDTKLVHPRSYKKEEIKELNIKNYFESEGECIKFCDLINE